MFVEKVHKELTIRKETLAVAESCTGGFIASKITQIPGASAFFLGGVIVYSNEMKQKLLGVPETLLATKGAVSNEVVRSMAEGLLKLTGCDWALAISGITGPTGGTKEKPVGTIYAAIANKKETISGLIPMPLGKSRQINIERSAEWLLEALWRKVVHDESAF